MADREKVIKWLEDVREYIRTSKDIGQRKVRMMDKVTNAIELLKERDAVEPTSHPAKAWTRAKTLWFCGACGARISKRKTKYCQECGTVVKWE